MKQDLIWTPFLILLYREVKRFYKVMAQTVLIPVINALIYLLIFGISLGKSIIVLKGVSYLEFLIPGLIVMGCMNNSYQNGSSSLLGMKFGGDIGDLKVSPLRVQQIIWAMSLGGLIRGLIVGAVILLVGELFHWFYEGAWLIPKHPFYFILFCSIGGLAFTKLGIAVGFFGKSFDHISAIGGFVIFPLIVLGGVFFPLDGLSPFWKAVSHLNPLFYFINGARYGFLDVSDVSLATAFFVSLLGLFIFHVVAVWSLHKGSYHRW